MFKKLRIQFIAVVMASVAIVLAIVFTAICVNEYQMSKAEVDQALSSTLDRACETTQMQEDLNIFMHGTKPPEGAEDDLGRLDGYALGGPQIGGGREDDSRSLVPVAVYMVSQDSSYTILSAYTTAQIDSDVLAEASSLIDSLDDGTGTLNEVGLHYEK